MLDRPAASVAVAAYQEPVLAQHRAPGVVWCRTVPELVVLARTGRIRAMLIDAHLAGLDLNLVASLGVWCPVVVVDGRAPRPRWEDAGADVIPTMPTDGASLEVAVGGHVARRPAIALVSDRAALVTVVEAPSGGGAGAATALARSLAATGPGSVVLADLTLDGLHRSLHGLSSNHAGLPELVAASRFGPPSTAEVDATLHPVAPGLRLLPGLRRHQDWISVGGHAAGVALGAVRTGSAVVVAHVDRDLEGEADTGSFDIEDRNTLARTAVRAADLVIVSGRSGPAGHAGLLATLESVAAFRGPSERTLALATGSARIARRNRRFDLQAHGRVLLHREGDLVDLRLGHAVRTQLAALVSVPRAPAAPTQPEPQRVVPGALGHWAHDIEGWITPRVPQQP
ncbi:MAG: hypothetical protein JWO77_2003 [Ilumatobacteraceae bacterium]|nr:hypothetical protein [Ilumatobacteraceae bacterium]